MNASEPILIAFVSDPERDLANAWGDFFCQCLRLPGEARQSASIIQEELVTGDSETEHSAMLYSRTFAKMFPKCSRRWSVSRMSASVVRGLMVHRRGAVCPRKRVDVRKAKPSWNMVSMIRWLSVSRS